MSVLTFSGFEWTLIGTVGSGLTGALAILWAKLWKIDKDKDEYALKVVDALNNNTLALQEMRRVNENLERKLK